MQAVHNARLAREDVGLSRKGFTLIELLVVIAVIAILASLLLAASARAKSRADSAVCKSNLHQLGIALSSYTADGDAYPALWNFGSGRELDQTVARYTGTHVPGQNYSMSGNGWSSGTILITNWVTSVYACPGYNRLPGLYDQGNTAYGYNVMGAVEGQHHNDPVLGLSGISSGERDGDWVSRKVKPSEVVAPSEMIALADANVGFPGLTYVSDNTGIFAHWGSGSKFVVGSSDLVCVDDYALLSDESPPPVSQGGLVGSAYAEMSTILQRRHNGRWNTWFCDGHVESLRARDLHVTSYAPLFLNLDNHSFDRVLRRWNLDNLPHHDLAMPP